MFSVEKPSNNWGTPIPNDPKPGSWCNFSRFFRCICGSIRRSTQLLSGGTKKRSSVELGGAGAPGKPWANMGNHGKIWENHGKKWRNST